MIESQEGCAGSACKSIPESPLGCNCCNIQQGCGTGADHAMDCRERHQLPFQRPSVGLGAIIAPPPALAGQGPSERQCVSHGRHMQQERPASSSSEGQRLVEARPTGRDGLLDPSVEVQQATEISPAASSNNDSNSTRPGSETKPLSSSRHAGSPQCPGMEWLLSMNNHQSLAPVSHDEQALSYARPDRSALRSPGFEQQVSCHEATSLERPSQWRSCPPERSNQQTASQSKQATSHQRPSKQRRLCCPSASETAAELVRRAAPAQIMVGSLPPQAPSLHPICASLHVHGLDACVHLAIVDSRPHMHSSHHLSCDCTAWAVNR